jgi:hypothetical protein
MYWEMRRHPSAPLAEILVRFSSRVQASATSVPCAGHDSLVCIGEDTESVVK